MDELLPAFLVTAIGATLALVQVTHFSRNEKLLLLASFGAHVFSALMEVWLVRGLYGGGDFFSYATVGGQLSRLLHMDFWQFGPELMKVGLWSTHVNLPIDVSDWAGSSTGAMMVLGAFLSYFTGGEVYTLCLTVAVWAYFGQVALYRAFRGLFPDAFQRRLLIATLLVPSCVFWSSALLKESVAIGGMGYAFGGFVKSRRSLRPGPLLQIALGAAVVGLVKAYILFALIAAAGAWLYCEREGSIVRSSGFVRLVAAAVVAVGGIALLTRVFPEFSLQTFADRAAMYQEVGQEVRGASTYAIGDATRTTLAGQLAFAPLALMTSLFRPFLFEAKSPQVAVAALETAAFLGLTYRAVSRRPFRETLRLIVGSPPLAFCIVFCAVFGVGVGLTTTNLGALSRYRMPLIPFFAVFLLVLGAPFAGLGPAGAAGSAPGLPSRRLPTGARPSRLGSSQRT